MSDLSVERDGASWWTPAVVAEVAEMLASRQSRLWQLVDPSDLAEWVFANHAPAPLDPPPVEAGGDWRRGLDEPAGQAWALAGWVVRTVVPQAAGTAGQTWHLSYLENEAVLRLTVGVLEILGLYESGEAIWLRVHAAPIGLAMETGAVDLDEWERRGVEMLEDGTKTLAEEKFLVRCPDLHTARWLLRQPPVIAGLRLLSCWVAAGPYSFEGRYRPEVVGRAWRASELLQEAAVSPDAGADDKGFDRQYAGAAATADLPAQRSFDADAYRAGVREHDRLCRLLIEQLARSNVRAGAGLAGVDVDLAWRDREGRQFVAEVKSIGGGNEADQLRLGLGQVLEYRHRLAAAGTQVIAVLLVSACTTPAWREVCGENGVLLLSGESEEMWVGHLRAATVSLSGARSTAG
ncbi:hypothetical protein [Micromonospora avicenniae]|uniref:hypothetical protein n=1 Tax=Micromonospora avicenniae TaxID=1198245 RepID=UPI0033244EE3